MSESDPQNRPVRNLLRLWAFLCHLKFSRLAFGKGVKVNQLGRKAALYLLLNNQLVVPNNKDREEMSSKLWGQLWLILNIEEMRRVKLLYRKVKKQALLRFQ